MTTFKCLDFKSPDGFTDPLSFVKLKKEFLRDLMKSGMKGAEIKRILYHEYESISSIFSRQGPYAKCLMKADNDQDRNLAYTQRRLEALLQDKNISSGSKDVLKYEKKIISLKRVSLKNKCGIFSEEKRRFIGPRNPKTEKQMLGFQIAFLFSYISKFKEKVNQTEIRQRDYGTKDVLELIAELLNETDEMRNIRVDSWKKIKYFYENAEKVK